jgi:hypothetical protein
MGSLKIQEAFLVCWQYAFNLSSFEREADGSIIQDPVYGVINMIMDKLKTFWGLTNAISDATREVDQTGRHELNMNVSFDVTKGLTLENRVEHSTIIHLDNKGDALWICFTEWFYFKTKKGIFKL